MRTRTLIAVLALLVLGTIFLYMRESDSSRPSTPPSISRLRPQVGIVVDPTNGELLKTMAGQLFHSTDDGRGWRPVPIPARLAPNGISQIVINPERPAIIYAAGFETGVLMSRDRGVTWQQMGTGLPSTQVDALAIHAFRRETLFVSVRAQGMYRTEDGGQRWQRMDGGPPVQAVLALAHSPLEGSMNTGWLYAGANDGPYISMDCF